MTDRSKHQDKVIRNYYQNREEIAIQRLQELATELYLSEGAKKRAQLWKNAVTHLEALKVSRDQIDHLVKTDKAELLASYVKTLLKK
jgi:hypothetical protein